MWCAFVTWCAYATSCSRAAVGQAMPGDDTRWLFDLQPSFLADRFLNSSFYFHRETTDKLVREWLERAGMPKVREQYLLFHSLTRLWHCLCVCLFVSDLFDNYNLFISLFICTQSFPKKFDSPDNELVSQVENEVGDNCWSAMHGYSSDLINS